MWSPVLHSGRAVGAWPVGMGVMTSWCDVTEPYASEALADDARDVPEWATS